MWNYWNYTSNQWVVGQCFAWDAANNRCAFLLTGNNGELIASWNPNSYSQPWERLSKNDLISIGVPTSNPDIVGCFYPSGSGARMAATNMQEEFETNDFGTDPNPSSGKVMVKFSGQTGSMGSLVVHDMMGKTLVTDSIEANVGKLIELPNHFVGMSLFTLTTDAFIKTKKVMMVK